MLKLSVGELLGIVVSLCAGCAVGWMVFNGNSEDRPPRELERRPAHPHDAPILRPTMPSEAPQLTLSRSSVDVGMVRMGEELKVAVDARNSGNKTLVLGGIKARCGCIQTTLIPALSELHPGEKTRIQILLRMTNHVGRFKESVVAYSNDPKSPSQRITISGNVVGGVQTVHGKPPRPVLPGEFRGVEFELRGSGDLPSWKPSGALTWIDGATKDERHLALDVESVSHEGLGLRYRVRAQLPATTETGRRRVWIRVKADGLPESYWPATVFSYEVYPSIRSSLKALYLGVLGKTTQGLGRVRLLPGTEHVRFSILNAYVLMAGESDPHPSFDVSFESDDRGWHVDVMHLGVGLPAGRIRASLVIETDNRAVPRVVVPVEAVVPVGDPK